MARNSEQKVIDAREAVDAEQGIAVEALYRDNAEQVNFLVAQRIGLISSETITRINEVFADHQLYFERALETGAKTMPPLEAYKRAFEMVYGRFLFEQRLDGESLLETRADGSVVARKDIEHKDGRFINTLGEVLKFKVDGSIRGRSELQSASQRLNRFDSMVPAEGVGQELIDDQRSELSGHRAASTEAERKRSELTGHLESADNLVGNANLEGKLDDLRAASNEIAVETREIATILSGGVEISRAEESQRLAALGSLNDDLQSIVDAQSLYTTIDQLERSDRDIKTANKHLDDLRDKELDSLTAQLHGTTNEFQNALTAGVDAVSGLGRIKVSMVAAAFSPEEIALIDGVLTPLEAMADVDAFNAAFASQTVPKINALLASDVFEHFDAIYGASHADSVVDKLRTNLENLLKNPAVFEENESKMAEITANIAYNRAKTNTWRDDLAEASTRNVALMTQVFTDLHTAVTPIFAWDLAVLEELFPGVTTVVNDFQNEFNAASPNFGERDPLLLFINDNYARFITRITEVLMHRGIADVASGIDPASGAFNSGIDEWEDRRSGASSPASFYSADRGFLASMLDKLGVYRQEVAIHNDNRELAEGVVVDSYQEIRQGQEDIAAVLQGLDLDTIEGLSPGFKQIVEVYLAAYAGAGLSDDPTSDNQIALGDFIDNTFIPFADAVRDNLSEGIHAQSEELTRLGGLIATTLTELSRLTEGTTSKVLAKMADDIRKQHEEIAEERTKLEERQTDLTAERGRVDGELTTRRAERDALIVQRDALVADKARVDASIEAKDTEIAEIVTKIGELEAEIRTAEGNINAINISLGHLEAAKGQVPGIESALTKYVDSETTRKAEEERLEREIIDLESELAQLGDNHIIKALSNDGVDFPSLRKRLQQDNIPDDEIDELEKEIDACDSEAQRIVWSRILLRIPSRGRSSLLEIANPGEKVSNSVGSFASKYSKHRYTTKKGDNDTAHARASKHMALGGKALATLKGAIESTKFGDVRNKKAELERKRAELEDVKGRKVDISVLHGEMEVFADKIEAIDTSLPAMDGNPIVDSVRAQCGDFTNDYAAISRKMEAGEVTIDELQAFMDKYLRSPFLSTLESDLEAMRDEELRNKADLDAKLEAKKLELDAANEARILLKAESDELAVKISEKNGEITVKDGEIAVLEARLVAIDSELAQIQTDLDGLDTRVGELNGMRPSDWLIGKSFGDFNPVAYRKAERGVKERKSEMEAARKAEDYFETAELRNLTAEYDEYESDAAPYADDPLSEQITELDAELKALNTSLRRRIAPDNEAQIREDIKTKSKQMEKLKSLRSRSDKLVKAMQILSGHIEMLVKLDIYEFPGGSLADIKTLKDKLAVIDINKPSFKCRNLIALGGQLRTYYKSIDSDALTDAFDESDARLKESVGDAEDGVKEMDTEKALNRDLSDSAAGKKIHMAIIEEQFGDELTLEQKNKLAALVLADDIELMQVDKDYAELAGMGSAELYDCVRNLAFKNKLIDFRYKDGDKTVQPFKGLKPEQFNTWKSVEQLFKIGKLNLKNGFFYLAGLEGFEGDDKSLQYYGAEKKLKELVAKDLGVEDRMDEAGINKIVNEAFDMHMESARPMMSEFYELDNNRRSEWMEYKVYELNTRYKSLAERRKLGEIGPEMYAKKLNELIEEAEDFGVVDDVDFSTNTMMMAWWNSPQAQKMRDAVASVGNYTVGKAGRALAAGGILAAKGVWGGVKTTANVGLQSALFPIRATKYPLMLAAKPLVGFINLFRKQKWVPLPGMRDSLRHDVGRVTGFFKGEAGKRWDGTKDSFTTVPGEQWKKTQYEYKAWKERTNVDKDALKTEAEEFAEMAEVESIESEGNGVIDMEKFRKRIAELDKINNSAVPDAPSAAAA
jgi:uncharacterized protein (DUF3084 family)